MIAHSARLRGLKTVSVDMRTIRSHQFSQALAKELCRQLGISPPKGRAFQALYSHVEAYEGPGVLVTLDEMDVVAPERIHDILSKFAHLNWGVRHRVTSRFELCIGSRRPLMELERGGDPGSPHSNQFHNIDLMPLDFADAARLICEPSTMAGRSLASETKWLVRFAGTWPFYLKLACHYAFGQKPSTRPLKKKDRDTIEEIIWAEAYRYLALEVSLMSPQERDAVLNISKWNPRPHPITFFLLSNGYASWSGKHLRPSCILFDQALAALRTAPAQLPENQPKKTLRPLDAFVSYSHKDDKYRNELEAHLSLLKRQDKIRLWTDHRIVPGQNWRQEIGDNLSGAGLVLLLISADFLRSDFCWNIELRESLERHSQGYVTIVPIILRPCDWTSAPFARLQGLPADAKPVSTWKNRDAAWQSVAAGIRSLIDSSASLPRRS
jgi:hypothetical protein